MVNLSFVKYVFFDIDGVLSAPRFINEINKFVSGFDGEDWLQYNVNTENLYRNCIAPRLMKKFVSQCASEGKRLFCITQEETSVAYYNKVTFVMENYPEFKEQKDILFTSTASGKLDLIKCIAKRDSLRLDECLLIEDTFRTVLDAEQLGIRTMHVSHLLDMEG